MRMIVIGLMAVSLAACGSGLVQIDEGNSAGPQAEGGAAGGGGGGDPSKPDGSGGPAGQGAPQPPTPGIGRNTREATIAECVTDLTRNLPRGTDVQRLCTCSVDRMIARTPQREAVRQCATEQNVRLPGV